MFSRRISLGLDARLIWNSAGSAIAPLNKHLRVMFWSVLILFNDLLQVKDLVSQQSSIKRVMPLAFSALALTNRFYYTRFLIVERKFSLIYPLKSGCSRQRRLLTYTRRHL